MNTMQSHADVGAIIDEANALLGELRWPYESQEYLQGASVSVTVHPFPASRPNRYTLVITVLPFDIAPSLLRGTVFSLEAEDGIPRYDGRLDAKGQLVLENIARLPYYATLTARRTVSASALTSTVDTHVGSHLRSMPTATKISSLSPQPPGAVPVPLPILGNVRFIAQWRSPVAAAGPSVEWSLPLDVVEVGETDASGPRVLALHVRQRSMDFAVVLLIVSRGWQGDRSPVEFILRLDPHMATADDDLAVEPWVTRHEVIAQVSPPPSPPTEVVIARPSALFEREQRDRLAQWLRVIHVLDRTFVEDTP